MRSRPTCSSPVQESGSSSDEELVITTRSRGRKRRREAAQEVENQPVEPYLNSPITRGEVTLPVSAEASQEEIID